MLLTRTTSGRCSSSSRRVKRRGLPPSGCMKIGIGASRSAIRRWIRCGGGISTPIGSIRCRQGRVRNSSSRVTLKRVTPPRSFPPHSGGTGPTVSRRVFSAAGGAGRRGAAHSGPVGSAVRPQTGQESPPWQPLALAVGTDADLLEDAEDLVDRADEEPLLVDLDPDAGARGEDDVIAGVTGIFTPACSHQSRPGPTATTIPCWGGGSRVPAGTTRPDCRTRSGSSSLITTWSKSGRRRWRMVAGG